ncbi:MAG: hypothetical protein ABFR90_06975 [Planctomycetota bacterium]
MKILAFKHLVRVVPPITLGAALLCLAFSTSGCVALSLLLSPGPFENKTVPEYDLKAQQERKVLIWIECPHSAGTDFDVREKLISAFQRTLTVKGEFESENVILNPIADSRSLLLDPVETARSMGAGYVLLVQVDDYSVDYLHVRNYYSGEIITRAVLQDTDLRSSVWPKQPEGKMVHITVEMETEGRDALVSRLASAAAHCNLRYLLPWDKLTYEHIDERISSQEVYEMETY